MKEKFYITNISCSSCANKIESALQKLECVSYVHIDTNNNILEIDTTNINLAIKTIKSIESNINISKENPTTDEFDTKKELCFLSGLIAVFLIAVIVLHVVDNEITKYISIGILIIIYLISGKDIFKSAFNNIKKRDFFDENTLMFIATISAFAIQAYEEAVAVMLFFKTGEFLQDLAVQKGKKSIKNLLQIAPNIAHLKQDSNIIDIPPQDLKIDDIFIVKPGEKIPTDGIVINGKSLIDTKALTGEPIPKEAQIDTKILGGTLNLNGILEIKVTKLYEDSSVAKIIDLVQNASNKKAKMESFITKFARIYTPIVFFIALAIAILPPLFGFGEFGEWIYRALVVLMVSCPCALVISVPLAYFGGIGSCSKNHILIKGANYLEALSNVSHIAFDKTGTLTKGVFKVVDIIPQNGFSKDDVLQYAFCAENFSNHPIALSIKDEYNKTLHPHQCNNTKFEQISGLGIMATCNYKEILAGNDKILHKYNIKHNNCDIDGSVAHIAIDGVYAGYILVADELKEDSLEALKELQNLGVTNMIMLTGDNEFASKKICDKLGLENVKYNLLPEEKAKYFIEFKQNASGNAVFIGDGINDAPCIALADIGVSMGKLGSDVSKESADVLIINDKISSMVKAIEIAKKTKNIIYQNIAFAFIIKILFIILGVFGVATIWEAVFGDVGVALLALLNSMRILKA
ncbi:heavy metal translocating P-type ATPase [Helicobacter sp. MIT 99-5507]|uniref:heavy metal translocating P-type ATPase n=1 Tax=Helicobacter sp. MIT 99-5507 TaxID=152489 RepID=UPI000E1F0665|nr:heavy metal translocating P-type ATPase [Helicobacter sp. MIT 99-5507]RDU58337.1 cadmium-translocating P-type ATPase [Helicobacter sp. MIT 99-5507]